MKEFTCIVISFILFFCSYQDDSRNEILSKKIKNINVKSALNEYLEYLDSNTVWKGSYIVVDAEQINDSLTISFSLSGGSYDFFHKDVVDFLKYKNYDVLLTGDFPSKIIKVKKLKKSDIEKIIQERYPDDYKKYQLNKSSIGPIMADYMEIYLIFKKCKLISFRRQYF